MIGLSIERQLENTLASNGCCCGLFVNTLCFRQNFKLLSKPPTRFARTRMLLKKTMYDQT